MQNKKREQIITTAQIKSHLANKAKSKTANKTPKTPFSIKETDAMLEALDPANNPSGRKPPYVDSIEGSGLFSDTNNQSTTTTSKSPKKTSEGQKKYNEVFGKVTYKPHR